MGVHTCLKPLCGSTGWGCSLVLSHMWRICKHRITCLKGLIAFQILVWGLPGISGFVLLQKDAKQSWEISNLGLVLLNLNTKSDPHPGMGVWEPRNSYRPTVKQAGHQLFPQTGILATMCRLNLKIFSSELLSYRAGNKEMPLSGFEKTSYCRLSISGKIHLLYYLHSAEVEEGKLLELIQT